MCFVIWFYHVIRDFPIEFSSEFSIFCDFAFFILSKQAKKCYRLSKIYHYINSNIIQYTTRI